MNNPPVNNPTSPKVLVLASRNYDVMNKSGRARIFGVAVLSEHADVTVELPRRCPLGGG